MSCDCLCSVCLPRGALGSTPTWLLVKIRYSGLIKSVNMWRQAIQCKLKTIHVLTLHQESGNYENQPINRENFLII